MYATALSFQEAEAAPPLVLLSLDLGWWIAAEDEWFLRGYLSAELKLATFAVDGPPRSHAFRPVGFAAICATGRADR